MVKRGKSGPPVGCTAPKSVGESGFVVLRLSNRLKGNTHKLFFDNYFCSPRKGFGQLAIGTIDQGSVQCLVRRS